MVSRQRSRRHASARVITITALAAAGWLAMGAVAAPSFAANGNGQGLATAPGQLSKLGSTATTTITAGTFGDPAQAQPLSTADLNPGGANNGSNCGAYCSTRDGAASLNGSTTGNATGEPCAGCVGKADNKNPPGQRPDGTDHNQGYECDGNSGIGKTNPAHTGCAGASQSCTVTTPCGTSQDCTVTHTCGSTAGDCTVTNTCGGTIGNCTVTSSCPPTPPGCAPTTANGFCSTVLGVQHVRRTTPAAPTNVLGEKLTRTPPSVSPRVLPFTGAAVWGMLGASIGLVLLGGLVIGLGRRRVAPLAS